MSDLFETILKKYTRENSSSQESQYLKLINRFIENQANDFFASKWKTQPKQSLSISNIKFENYQVLAINDSQYAFENTIRNDFEKELDSKFLLGFVEVVQSRIDSLRKEGKNQQFRGRLLTFAKNLQEYKYKNKNYPCYDRPIVFRLDYSIVYHKVDFPDLKGPNGVIREIILLAYTLSSIKKESFTKEELTYYINDSYELLRKGKTELTPQDLIEVIVTSKWFNLYKQNFIYKNVHRDKLFFDAEASKQTLPYLKNIKFVLTYTKWQNGDSCFGTAFFFNYRTVITSSKNLAYEGQFTHSDFEVCLQPFQNERKWIAIQRKDIEILQHSQIALVILPQKEQQTEEQTEQAGGAQQSFGIKIQDHSNGLPSSIHYSYVCGFRFYAKGQQIIFHTSLSCSCFNEKSSYDLFYSIRSPSSSGSLVFFVQNNIPKVFGIYNAYNKGVFNFNLIHGVLSQQIYDTIQRRQLFQTQSVLGLDQRQDVPFDMLNKLPYSAVGMIYCKIQFIKKKKLIRQQGDNGDGFQGTGALIAPNIILTCAHNFLQFKSSTTIIATQAFFYPGLSKQHNQNKLSEVLNRSQYPYYTINIQDIYIPKAFFANYTKKNDLWKTSDMAILYLKNNLHSSFLSIKSVPQKDQQFWEKTELHLCGYPAQSKGTMKEAKGKSKYDTSSIIQKDSTFKTLSNTLYYEIDTSQGNSGGPVIVKSIESAAQPGINNFEVVAVHNLTKYDQQQAGVINSGNLLVDENLKFIKEKIQNISNAQAKEDTLKQFYDKL